MTTNRLDAIKKAAQPKVESPLSKTVPKDRAKLIGARTGWNPNPGVGEVRTYTPEPLAPPARPAGRASDAILDKAKAHRATAGVVPPSGAVTGPRLRQDYRPSSRYSPPMSATAPKPRPARAAPKPQAAAAPPKLKPGVRPASRYSPPMNVATSVQQPVSVRTQRPGRPPAPPRLKPGARPAPRWSAPVAAPAAPKPRRLGGGRWGAAATVAVHAGTTLANEVKRKERKK